MRRVVSLVAVLFFVASPVRAQSFEAGVHFASSDWSEFDGVDRGAGGRLTWRATPRLGVDADVTWYPGDYPPDSFAFSGSRFEGLFGVTYGPRLDRVRPFVKAAAGFLRSSEAPEPFACIAIFPPPLNCLLGAGHTMAAYEFGGGVAIDATSSSFVRIDVADRMLGYPGPSLGADFERRDEGFFGHALRFTIGAGFRF
jgi:hypothetical protein